jgi:hypothetical protein
VFFNRWNHRYGGIHRWNHRNHLENCWVVRYEITGSAAVAGDTHSSGRAVGGDRTTTAVASGRTSQVPL